MRNLEPKDGEYLTIIAFGSFLSHNMPGGRCRPNFSVTRRLDANCVSVTMHVLFYDEPDPEPEASGLVPIDILIPRHQFQKMRTYLHTYLCMDVSEYAYIRT